MHVRLGASARDLWEEGRLAEAITRLSAELRAEPGDRAARTFLFELLITQGEWERASRQLATLRGESPASALGLLQLAQALEAEVLRGEWYTQTVPKMSLDRSESTSGTLNEEEYAALSDADPLVGARLEVFHVGKYLRIPFREIATIRMQAPTQLWHTIWIPAVVRLRADTTGESLGRVLLPTRSSGSETDDDADVCRGRTTVWRDVRGVVRPCGQKVLLADDRDIGLLDVRSLDVLRVPAFAT